MDGSLPTRSTRVRIEDGDLTLEKIRQDDRGKYECVATNIVTRVVTATQLIVECKTSFRFAVFPHNTLSVLVEVYALDIVSV